MKRTPLLRKTPLRSTPKKWGARPKEPKGPRIDKSALNVPTCERIRDPAYLKWVRTLSCVACGKSGPSDAHHIRTAKNSGTGIKPSDEFVVPLCRGPSGCHMEYHSSGAMTFEEKYSINLLSVARNLWLNSPDRRK